MGEKLSDRNKGWDMHCISDARSQLFGVATLFIAVFHSYLSLNSISPVLGYLKNAGNVGVDMFFFLSAIGLYFSFSNDTSLRSFYRKRAVRLLPPLAIVSILWFATTGLSGVGKYLENVFLISFFTQGIRQLWFFAFLIVFYALFPLLYYIIKRGKLIATVVMVVMSVVFTLLLKEYSATVYKHVEIALTRIPVFLIGIWIAEFVKERKRISKLWLVILAVIAVGINVFIYFVPCKDNYFIVRYLYCLLGIALVFVLSALLSRFKIPFLRVFLIWFGTYSLEVCMLQNKIMTLTYKTFFTTGDKYFISISLATMVLTMLVSIRLKAVTDSLNKNLFSKKVDK